MPKSKARIRALAAVMAAALATVPQPAWADFQAESEPNDTQATAQSLDGFFTTTLDAEITNSTTWRHSSIRAGSSEVATFDWYSFTVAIGGTQGLFDIDHGMPGVDAVIEIYDSNGVLLASQDDGFAFDPGSENDLLGWDTYLTYLFASPDVYSLRVGSCCDIDGNFIIGVPTNGSYVLHASLSDAVPEPATWAMMLLGFGATGVVLRRRRPRAKALVTA